MKRLTVGLIALVLPLISYGAITSARSGNWSEPASWTGTVLPTSSDDVVISAGNVMIVDNATAVCKSISFADTTAKLNLNSTTSALSLYGDFNPYSTAHISFSNWVDGAVLQFAGSADTQWVNNIRNNNTETNMAFFKTIVVDKDSGVVTYAGSSDSKLNISNSLIVRNGTFLVPTDFDINGRSFNSTAYAYPAIIVESGGTFKMQGGATQVVARSGSSMESIGGMTIYGKVYLASTSTNRIRIGGIDVENGGTLFIPYYSSGGNMGSEKFEAGTINIKSGGTFQSSLNTSIWYSTTIMNLESGGTYKVNSTEQAFPPTFNNNGTVRYIRSNSTGSNQSVIDMDYYRLEISYGDSIYKDWALAEDREIADSLEINNSGNLRLTGVSGKKVTLNGTLRLTSGILDNSDSYVSLKMADGATISRATGSILATPLFDETVNVRYTSSQAAVTTGPEIPEDESVLKDLDCNSSMGIVLDHDITVNGELSVNDGSINTAGYTIYLASGATISEDDSCTVLGTVHTSRTVTQNTTADFGGIGLEVTPTGNSMGTCPVNRITGQSVTLSTGSSIKRYFQLSPATNTSLNATVVFNYDVTELNGIAGDNLALFVSSDGTIWTEADCQTDTTLHQVTANGLNTINYLTLGRSDNSAITNSSVVPVRFQVRANYPNPFNPMTTIPFCLPSSGTFHLEIYNLEGQSVVAEEKRFDNAGDYSFNVNAANWASGIYFYRLTFNGTSVCRKMVFLK